MLSFRGARGVAMALFLSVWANIALGAEIDSVRLWRAPDNTRIVFDLSGPVEYKLSQLSSPARLVIDIDNTNAPKNLATLSLAGTPVTQLLYSSGEKRGLRVVMELNSEIKPRTFLLVKHGDKPDRLVVDLFDNKDEKPADEKPAKEVVEVKSKPIQQTQSMDDTNSDRRDIVIAVDAGHGGEDPGAQGLGAIREKVVVLDISRRLVDLINQQKGYSARLVRTGDYYIALYDRRDKARAMRADLFVSIHADAFTNPDASGASVFALSQRGATSESAKFLASKENEADLIGGVGGVSLNKVDDVLAGVLVDLSMTATLSNSLDVGDRVLRELGKITRLHRRQVEQAGFVVLKSPDVPSILVETGFISNPFEAKKLDTLAHRNTLAAAIFKGINGYFNDMPPVGSYIAWTKGAGSQNPGSQTPVSQKLGSQALSAQRLAPVQNVVAQANKNVPPQQKTVLASTRIAPAPKPMPVASARQKYVIARGDTLADIAKRHNISLRKLMEHNGLTTEAVIKVGQKLDIPAG